MQGQEQVNTEVNLETQEQVDANEIQPADSGQENNLPESIPYDKFKAKVDQVNELKEYKSKYEQLMPEIERFVVEQNQRAATSTKDEVVPDIDNVTDLLKFVEQKVEERIKPIQNSAKTSASACNN